MLGPRRLGRKQNPLPQDSSQFSDRLKVLGLDALAPPATVLSNWFVTQQTGQTGIPDPTATEQKGFQRLTEVESYRGCQRVVPTLGVSPKSALEIITRVQFPELVSDAP